MKSDWTEKDPRPRQALIGFIIIFITIFIVWPSGPKETARSVHKVAEPTQTVRPTRSAGELEALVQGLRLEGVITWVDADLNHARVNWTTWLAMDVGEKQMLVMLLSEYFDAMGSTGRVTIMSNLNDRKLATYSVWAGIKIKV